MAERVAVTGANGAIGRAVVGAALDTESAGAVEVVAAVRSERALAQLPPIPEGRGRAARISYEAPGGLEEAFAGARAVIHLPGLLVERRDSSYEQANVETTARAVAAARACAVEKLVLVSACGAEGSSRNRFFRTKAEAEALVRESGLRYAILRAPLVLGRGTEGARALAREAGRRTVLLVGGGRTWHQPLDVEDLARGALHAALQPDVARDATLDVVGPERLRYRDLVARAARLCGREARLVGLPVAPLRWLLEVRRRLLGPGLDPDALDVLLSDTGADAAAAAGALAIQLTPLDVTLRRSLELPEDP